jgi:hypothetical protein
LYNCYTKYMLEIWKHLHCNHGKVAIYTYVQGQTIYCQPFCTCITFQSLPYEEFFKNNFWILHCKNIILRSLEGLNSIVVTPSERRMQDQCHKFFPSSTVWHSICTYSFTCNYQGLSKYEALKHTMVSWSFHRPGEVFSIFFVKNNIECKQIVWKIIHDWRTSSLSL